MLEIDADSRTAVRLRCWVRSRSIDVTLASMNEHGWWLHDGSMNVLAASAAAALLPGQGIDLVGR